MFTNRRVQGWILWLHHAPMGILLARTGAAADSSHREVASRSGNTMLLSCYWCNLELSMRMPGRCSIAIAAGNRRSPRPRFPLTGDVQPRRIFNEIGIPRSGTERREAALDA
jgi:hypothetical protein